MQKVAQAWFGRRSWSGYSVRVLSLKGHHLEQREVSRVGSQIL